MTAALSRRRHEAEKLVVDGFFVPVLDRIPLENVRDRMMAGVERKLLGELYAGRALHTMMEPGRSGGCGF